MKLFVFDLDYTLWNAGETWCDCTTPPYYWSNDKLLDQGGRWLRLYNGVPEILAQLKACGKLIAAASRTGEPDWAEELLQLFAIDHFFDTREIYPGNKSTHLDRILQFSQIPKGEVVFFDDEHRNIRDIRSMGIESVLVDEGLNWSLVKLYL